MFDDPSTSTGIEWKELHGSLLLIKPHEVIAEMATVHGTSSAVRADVIVLDGDKADEVYDDTLIFPKLIQSQVKSKIGGMVLGRLGQGNKKPGQSPPWTLSAATEDDKKKGRAYLEKTQETPF